MKLTISQIYLVFVIANIFCKGIGLNNSSVVYKIIMIIGLTAVLLGIGSRRYTRKEISLSAGMLLSGLMTLLITKQYTFLITCITAIGIKGADVNRLMKKICSVRTVCFILIFGLAFLNVIDRDRMEIWRETALLSRYGMGYGHPNTLHLTLFIVLTLNFYINVKSKSGRKKFLFATFILNIFVYMYSASRTGFLVICIFELLIMTEPFKVLKKIVIKLPAVVFVSLMAFTFLTPVLKETGLLNLLNFLNEVSFLNGRMDYTYLYLTRYGYSLFGYNNSLSETGLVLDNGYLRLLIETGIIGLLIWVYLNLNLMRKIWRCKDYRMAIVVTCFYIYIFAESFSSNIFMNYILFWGADELFNQKNNEVAIDGNDFYADIQQKNIASEIKSVS